ncbi:hypothetical protein MLD38_008852 [Melastoma candidum]|uniref:Uncharacterized protein n=1 Tax=Melastoma candidum TaxID=119954 RepID=A0ACB9RVN5_9MYRT|nr:hypothetical protein MLD38_008852 [Melastoma candidum]
MDSFPQSVTAPSHSAAPPAASVSSQRLLGKVALVTGGASGIGETIRAKGVGKLGIGIQADLPVKSEKLASSLKPSGSLHQDGMTRRKMKKSRSLSLDGMPQPGRPPPPPAATLRSPDVETATPPRQQSESRGKSRLVLPNYMRSTTCSDARKENSQVTHLQSGPMASAAKVSHRRCSTGSLRPRLSPGSGKYSPSSATRNLKRSSSLKLVRTLTKAPSFKPTRSTSANKCTQVVVCADSSIQKATCSSTLKETKYPEYLMLNPGGTEAEGTSIFKVCPYTYCSLNGHRHGQLPPLKRFVAARRRLLKAQKSAKIVPVSPARFCQGSLDDKSPIRELDVETDFFVEIYAKSEKQGSLSIDKVVCVGEDEGDYHSPPSEEGSCMYGSTRVGAYDEHSDDGLKGHINLGKNVEYCGDTTETEIDGCSDNLSREKEETMPQDIDEIYYLIMAQKERLRWSRSQRDEDGDKLLEGSENIDVCSADCKDDDWDEVSSSSVLEEAEELVITETEGCDKDASENKEDQKEGEKLLHVCSARLQEDGMDCASGHSMLSQVSDCMFSCQNTDAMNATAKDTVEAEAGDFPGDCSQPGLEVSFEESDGDNATGAQTMSTDLVLQTEADDTGSGTSLGRACFEPQDDAFTLDHLHDLAEINKETAKRLIDTGSEAGLQDEEERRAVEPTSEGEVPIELLIPGTSAKDSGEADRSITKLEFTRGQENDESTLRIPNRMNGTGDADDHEGSSTGAHQSEEPAGESQKEDVVNKAAELNTNSSVPNGATSMRTKSRGVYSRGKGKSREELSDSSMIWRINRREKCDKPDDDPRNFNPRDPNYLPIVPDPEGERVDLRHQIIDDRRNSDEWMIDYALQRAVSKLESYRNYSRPAYSSMQLKQVLEVRLNQTYKILLETRERSDHILQIQQASPNVTTARA